MTSYANRLQEDALSIFLFHGVIESPTSWIRNYTNKHLLAERFDEIITELSGVGTPVSMDEVVAWSEGQVTFGPRPFAVTFDDGFENNFSVAAPILRTRDVPATFYVSTHLIDENAMSWIDRIEFAIESGRPDALRLPWRTVAVPTKTREQAIACLDEVRERVKSGVVGDVDGLVSDVFEQCDVTEIASSSHPLDQKMSWEQVRRLNQDEHFLVGGHSHHHVVLAFLARTDLEAEVTTSLDLLHKHSAVGPRHYSYPEGLEHCYSEDVIAVLRDNGVRCCPTAIDGANPPGMDLFHLRRIPVA